MRKLERYINSIYKNVKGSPEEISSWKEETRSQLLQIIKELQMEGKSEKESLYLAIERFGNIKKERKRVFKEFNISENITKGILITALMFAIMGIMSIVMLWYGGNYVGTKYSHDYTADLAMISKEAIEKDQGVADVKINKIFNQYMVKLKQDGEQLNYMYIYKFPKDYDIHSFNNNDNSKAQYTYFNNRISDMSFDFSSKLITASTKDNIWLIKIEYTQLNKADKLGSIVGMFRMISVFSTIAFVLYWLLFGVWAAIKAHQARRLHLMWTIAFFTVNIPAYILFKLTGHLNVKFKGTPSSI
ncbi:MAG: hypothetical protein Q8936_19805 [Bacillota bacterium]|nr:hypothetical protein [Bacillota bacterium]